MCAVYRDNSSGPLPWTPVPQAVVVLECVRGGHLLEEPRTLQFSGDGFSLQVSIQDLPQLLWSIKPSPPARSSRSPLVWGRDHHPLQCAFSLESLGPPPTPPQLSCKIMNTT
ncbi:unnamed protein product [Arctogadus glacialis]